MVQEERLIQEFMRLVSIDAESYRERKMADYLLEQLRQIGMEDITEDEAALTLKNRAGNEEIPLTEMAGNLYACLPGTDGSKRSVLFAAHMDTVCPGNGKQAIRHADGRITSAGDTVLGADDAAGIAAILEMLRVVKERELPHPEIEVFFPAAEEPFCQGSRLFDYSRVHADRAYILDLSGPMGRAAIAAPAIYSVDVMVTGKSAHAGFSPESGIHAIRIAAEAISQLPYGHVEDDTTVNLGTITGGTARNIVPDQVHLTGEIRSMSSKKAEDWLGKIREIFTQTALQYGGTAMVSCEKNFEAYRIEEKEPVVQTFKKAAKALGLPGTLLDTFGGSDNNNLNAAGIHGIVLACAMNEVHTVREYTTVRDLKTSAELLLEIIRQCERGSL